MHRFYLGDGIISGNRIELVGEDCNHIRNVLRMRIGEKLTVCDGQGLDYICRIVEITGRLVVVETEEKKKSDAELETKLVLFQGLPKKDKMELIVQKAVELGVSEIVPVMMERTIVRLEDPKKEERKLERWRSISEGAAKQSGRGIIPEVSGMVSFKDAIARMKTMDLAIMPYENEEGMAGARQLVSLAHGKKEIGILIGPEGGISDDEAEYARNLGIRTMSLGKRILRTETAGLCTLSILQFELS